jgi:hypothetical protein
MIDEQLLRSGLQKLLKETESAIRERLADEPSLQAQLKERHDAAVRAERAEGSKKGFLAFSDEAITQSSVHWLLGCVFVRFLEDNGWLDDRNSKVAWISGPGERLAIAKDRRTLFLRPDPSLTDRDYLLHVFDEVAKLPGVAGVFDPKHNPLYSLQPTAQGAAKIVEFFQKVDPDSNALIHDFSDPAHGTRFLGDLYQNLSESARKRYALCQTPGFVIDFILDRTLTPSLDAFGLETLRMIDPSCGSGHFLLAAFARLFRAWQVKEPGTNPPALVQRALDAVYGVDLNPFAVEISRFRLLIAALEASAIERLADAPSFRFNLAAGDSLLHGTRVGGGGIARLLFEDRLQHFYDTEDANELKRILGQPYHVVVGNPPYINVSDSVLREAYRNRFSTCHGKYQLGVPFTERFFDLTVRSEDQYESLAGWMGMIVSNAFMKRTFGKKLVEGYLKNRDLTHVIDTSGVYLPGHGTPTTILLARHRPPISTVVRAVRGIRGETGVPEEPAKAPVWTEIEGNIDKPGFEGEYVSISDTPRESFSAHPWAIGGGGAAELKEQIDGDAESTLAKSAADIGVFGICAADDVMVGERMDFVRRSLEPNLYRCLLGGDAVRDWEIDRVPTVFFPYIGNDIVPIPASGPLAFYLWPYRVTLGNRATFSGGTYLSEGRPWWGWHQLSMHRLTPPESIVFSDVATHNHFVLSTTPVAFDRHAPIIKLPKGASRDRYLSLLGVLNSSVSCFWLRQICYPKGGDHVGTEGARVTKNLWEERYDFDCTKLKQLPIPEGRPFEITQLLQAEAEMHSSIQPGRLCRDEEVPSRAQLTAASAEANRVHARMIALQEELDWKCYSLYGIIEDDLTLSPDRVPPLCLGERAFEVVLARKGEEPIWFERHRSTPIKELPVHWPEDYRRIVERRIAMIESNRDVALVERPEYKRRWNLPTWEEMEESALKGWLLNRIEQSTIWKYHTLVSCAQLRDALARDPDWLSVAEIYHGGSIEALDSFVVDLVGPEAVPYLPVLRYTESGLRKRAEWEAVWDLQRREDTGEEVDIPVPPKYVTKDMQKGDYWRLRGGLDVPKERFILYPFFQRDSDSSPVLGWAGWSYLEQAKALATYYQRLRTEEGWEAERLKPILAGLLDLKPWLLQWHNEIDPEMGERLGEYFVRYAESQCQELGFSPEEVRAWQPPAATVARRGRKKKQ